VYVSAADLPEAGRDALSRTTIFSKGRRPKTASGHFSDVFHPKACTKPIFLPQLSHRVSVICFHGHL
jgi:hypothetical protein